MRIAPGKDGRPLVEREVLRYKRGAYGAPFRFLDFSNGKGYAITNEEDFSRKDEDGPMIGAQYRYMHGRRSKS